MLTHSGVIRRITLDRRPPAVLAILSAAYALYLMITTRTFSGLFFFISGAAIAYPPIFHLWMDIEKNWGKEYKRFFYGKISAENRNKMILGHWKKTWWVLPYIFFVYGYCAFIALALGKAYALLLLAGSLFTTGIASYQAQGRLKPTKKV